MKVEKTFIEGLLLVYPDVIGDSRGWFTESYHKRKYSELGIDVEFVQDNHSKSLVKGTLRGLHFQTAPHAQSKLVRCIKGKIYDVAVDLRKESATYLKWFGIVLDDENMLQLFIPKGFAHGFLTLSDDVEIAYKVDDYYSKENDSGISYLDSKLAINWSDYIDLNDISVSEKDAKLPSLE